MTLTTKELAILIVSVMLLYLFFKFLYGIWEENAAAKRRTLEKMNRIPRANYSQSNNNKHGKTKKSTPTGGNPGSRRGGIL